MKLQHTVAQIASLVGGEVDGQSDLTLDEFCECSRAGPSSLVAAYRPEFLKDAIESGAGCLLVDAAATVEGAGEITLIRVKDPEVAVDCIVKELGPSGLMGGEGIHATAVVHETARIGEGASLGPGVIVEEGASIGAGAVLHPHVIVGWGCQVGDRTILHGGVVLGADGFGFRKDEQGHQVKVPQAGIVVIGEDVEIGANGTVDRARFDRTVVGDRTKFDDHVHIGHNAQIGSDCAFAGHVGIGGTVKVGDGVLIGGMTGVIQGVVLGEGTMVNGGSFVMRHTQPGEAVSGFPARPWKGWEKAQAVLLRLPSLRERIRALEAMSGIEAQQSEEGDGGGS